MKRVKRYIKREMDVEFFGAIHGLCFIFMYGFLQWINKINVVSFADIVQMWIVGYIVAWFQKILFLGTHYSSRAYKACVVAWNIGPMLIIIPAQILFKWFVDTPSWQTIVFNIVIVLYYVIMWVCLEIFYREDTIELNDLLKDYKNSLEEVKSSKGNEKINNSQEMINNEMINNEMINNEMINNKKANKDEEKLSSNEVKSHNDELQSNKKVY